MGDVLRAFLTVGIGIAVFLGALLALYGIANVLPRRLREHGRIAVFLGPALFVLLIGLLIPALRTMWFSFHGDGTGHAWAGFTNYRYIFTNPRQRDAITNSVLWLVIGGIGSTVIGLTIARFADGLRSEAAAKSLIFVPGALSLAGAGIIWRFVYSGPPVKGLLNAVTGHVPGLPEDLGGKGDRLWLLETKLGPVGSHFNTLLLIVILVWVQVGFATVVLSAAIKGVPDTLIEAARVDGATDRQVFYKVTLPYIRATLITVMTTGTIAALKAFDIVQATTGGNFKTTTIANEVYNTYFIQNRDGTGAALAVLLFVLVVPVVIVNQRAQSRARRLIGA